MITSLYSVSHLVTSNFQYTAYHVMHIIILNHILSSQVSANMLHPDEFIMIVMSLTFMLRKDSFEQCKLLTKSWEPATPAIALNTT